MPQSITDFILISKEKISVVKTQIEDSIGMHKMGGFANIQGIKQFAWVSEYCIFPWQIANSQLLIA